MAVVMALSTVFSCQKDYDNDIERLQESLSSLEETVKNLTYVKSITMDDKGVLTITPSVGSAITYDATKYVKYSIEVKNDNEIYVNGEKVGTIATPEVKDPTISVVNNELLVNGKSQDPKVMLPEAPAAIPSLAFVKDAEGKIVSITLREGENEYSISTSSALTSLVFIPEVVRPVQENLGFTNQVFLPTFKATPQSAAKLANEGLYYSKDLAGYFNVKYRVNPSNVDITKIDWSMVARTVVFRSADGDLNVLDVKKVEKYGSSAITAKVAFTKDGYETIFDGVEDGVDVVCPIVAMCGSTKDNDGNPVEVYSDNAALVSTSYYGYVFNKEKTKEVAGVMTYSTYSSVRQLDALKDDSVPADHKVAYDAKDVDLLDFVLAGAREENLSDGYVLMSDLNYDDYDFKFESVSYVGTDGNTDQSYFVKLDGSKFTPTQGVAGINRKPIFYVQMYDKTNGYILDECYIKFEIERVTTDPVQPKKEISIDPKTWNYNELFTAGGEDYSDMGKEIPGYSWEQMNALYNEIGMDHNTFKEVYSASTSTTKTVVNGEETSNAAIFSNDFNAANLDSYAFALKVTPYSKFGENTAVTTITPNDATKPELVINWKWNVVKPELTLDVIEGYRYQGSTTTVLTKGINEVGVGYLMKIYIGEAYNYAPALKAIFGNGDAGKVNGAVFSWFLNKDYENKAVDMLREDADVTYRGVYEEGKGLNGNSIDDIFGTDNRTGIAVQIADLLKEPERVYDFRFCVNYLNKEEDVLVRSIVFQNPITVKQVADNVLEDLVNAKADQKNFAKNFNVYFDGKLMVKGGVAMTGDSAVDGEEGTQNAAEFVDVNNANFGSFYTLNLPETIQYREVSKVNTDAKDGMFQWKNAGTTLQAEVVAAQMTYVFKTSFSEASIENSPIKVVPGN